ncbi:hypothetical protein NA56DRAFT_748980 [Hyaloscypha hepaticicola]|uniref:Uncharacterized protein n=1 Tax=Hyaloscypha hepaticicola TaxID=2082293 RepID=A0A2J6Q440_9HELO|nr:hypothetical protein NA56DRAFT_748980 [Hyaloscypha hepaticicola]
MSHDATNPLSESDFEYVGGTTSSMLTSDFTMINNPSPSNSEYDMLSDTGISSGTIGVQINNAAKNESPATTETDKSHALTFENKTMKTIDEVAGGWLALYGRDCDPAPGELIGDKKPGYEAMSLGAKFWSWWTKKEMRIFEAQIMKEINAKIEEDRQQAQGA